MRRSETREHEAQRERERVGEGEKVREEAK